MTSGTDRFASIESRIEIVMKMIVYNTILVIVEKNLPKMEVFDAHLISNLIGVAFRFESLDIAKK